MKEDDIMRHIRERFPKTEEFHIILRCWKWKDYERHREDGHCGEHTENIRGFFECPLWPTLMKNCREQAAEFWASERTTTVRVTCICDGSIHASVGIAAILQNMYHQCGGYDSKGPYHIGPPPRKCWNCEECRPNVQTDMITSVAAADVIRDRLWM